jgi:triphosphoribosyl-dephospho-CoA synthase
MNTSPLLKSSSTYAVSPAAAQLAALCRWALIAEAELTPKPGLVDRRGSGAHRDLSLPIMRRSALAIEPYFGDMAAVDPVDTQP